MIKNKEIIIHAGTQNLKIFYSYKNDTKFSDLLEYIAYLFPNYNICHLCFNFASHNNESNQNFNISNNDLITNYSGYLNNLYLIKKNINCEHNIYLIYSKEYIINHFINEVDSLKFKGNEQDKYINDKKIEVNNLKFDKFKQEENIKKLENEISGLKEMKKEKSDEIKKLTRDKKALELAINGDIEKIKSLEEIGIKGTNLKEKSNLIKIGENSKIVIENQEPQKADFKNFYDVIVHIDSIKDINKGWTIELSERAKNNYNDFISQKILRIGVIGNSNKGKSFLLSRISKIDLPSGTSIRTEGLSIKYPQLEEFKDRKIALLDSAGLEIPVLREEEAIEDNNDNKNEYFKEKSREKLITELFLQNYIINNSDILIVVVGILTYSEQKLLMKIKKELEKARINPPLYIIHNLITYTSVKQVKEYINDFLMKSATFNLEKGENINTKLEQKTGEYFIENKKDNKTKIYHLIYANEGSEAGKYYNKFTLEFIETSYNHVNHEKYDVIQTIKERYIAIYKDIIEKTDNSEKDITEESFDDSNPEIIKLKDNKEIILKKCLTDELGFSNLKANGFEPTYNIYLKGINLIVRMEAPGNVELSAGIERSGEYNMVKIWGEKKKDKEPENEKDNLYNIREKGKFSFQIPLKAEQYPICNKTPTIVNKKGLFIISYELEKKTTEGMFKDEEEV